MHVAFGRVRRKSRIGADSTDDADYGMGDGGRRSRVGNRELGFNGERAGGAYYFVSISEILRYKK